MRDPDIDVVAEAVTRGGECPPGDEDAAQEALEALDRLRGRLEVAEGLYRVLATDYTLVWPVPGVLISGKRRKRLIEQYERLRPGEPARKEEVSRGS